MNLVKTIIVLILATSSVGCATIKTQKIIQNRNKSYLSAQSIPPIRIPPGITTHDFQNQYPVSGHKYPLSATDVSLVPPGLYS